MHVVGLAERYMEEVKAEDAVPKQSGLPSVMDRFTDFLFPDTRGKGKDEKGRVRKKSKQLSQEEFKQVGEQRKKRKKVLDAAGDGAVGRSPVLLVWHPGPPAPRPDRNEVGCRRCSAVKTA
jgi:hypothetical protein